MVVERALFCVIKGKLVRLAGLQFAQGVKARTELVRRVHAGSWPVGDAVAVYENDSCSFLHGDCGGRKSGCSYLDRLLSCRFLAGLRLRRTGLRRRSSWFAPAPVINNAPDRGERNNDDNNHE